MGSPVIIVNSPRFDLRLGIGQRKELLHVQALVPKSPVKRLDERVIDRFAWPNEIELHAAAIRPVFQGARREVGAVVARFVCMSVGLSGFDEPPRVHSTRANRQLSDAVADILHEDEDT